MAANVEVATHAEPLTAEKGQGHFCSPNGV